VGQKPNQAPGLKIIDVFICKLRKKLANASEGRNFIETVGGRGYVLREPHGSKNAFPPDRMYISQESRPAARRVFCLRGGYKLTAAPGVAPKYGLAAIPRAMRL
jgi:hypothetical protein